MLVWIAFALLTAAVLVPVLAPLARAARPDEAEGAAEAGTLAVYRDQLAEIEAERARGLIGATEAEAARLEISRRLRGHDAFDRRLVESDACPLQQGGAPGFVDDELQARADIIVDLFRTGEDGAIDRAAEHGRIAPLFVRKQPAGLDRPILRGRHGPEDRKRHAGSSGSEPITRGIERLDGRAVGDHRHHWLRDVALLGGLAGGEGNAEHDQRDNEEQDEAAGVNSRDEIPARNYPGRFQHAHHAAAPTSTSALSSISRAAASPAIATKAS